MRELRPKLFAGTDDEDAYEHVRTVLEIMDLFHFPGVTHNAIMLRVFPIILKGQALRWKNRLPAGTITTWDILKKEFIWRYCHPFITAKKLEEIRNFKQERDETFIMLGKDTMIFFTNTADNERMRKILENTESNIRALKTRKKNLQEKAYQLTHKVLTNTGEKVKAITTMGKENMKEPVPHDLSPTPFPGHLKKQMGSPYRTREIVCMIENPEEIHNAKAQDDDEDMDVGWDITSKDVERLRQFLTPTIHTLPNLEPVVQPYIPLRPVHDMDKIVKEKKQDYDIPLHDSVMQPLTPQTVHITPPNDDYVAPATNPMSNKQLNKFEEEFSHITEVAEKEYDNPVIKTYDTMAGVDIDTLTMEQYLALPRENQAPSVVKPEIRGNVNFKIKSQFMCELREDTFSGNKYKDAHDHIDRVLCIVGLFNILEVSKDAVML
ncbi:Orf y [Tanacetum coccineum]